VIEGDFRNKVMHLQGPVLVLGASGFIGANLLRMILRHRSDAFGTSSTPSAWRLEDLPADNVTPGDLLIEQSLASLLDTPVGTVKGRMRLGLAKMRTTLGDPAEVLG